MTNKNSVESLKKEIENDVDSFDQHQRKLDNASHKSKSDSSNIGLADHSQHHAPSSDKKRPAKKTTPKQKGTNKHSFFHSRPQKSYRHSRKKPFRIISILLSIILVLAAIGYGFLHWELSRIQRSSEDVITESEVKDNVDSLDEFSLGTANASLIADSNIKNILLIGQDRRDGDKAEMRSDAMIICSINSKTKEIVLVSLMRDMYLPIPGYGFGLLNSTYLIGGFELLNETIEKNFGIPIQGDLEVDFSHFLDLMNIVGPIELNLSEEEARFLNNMQATNWAKQSNSQYAGDGLVPGTNTLNPKQVLLYCRMRKNVGGDWGRTDRQRKVVLACFNKLKHSGAKSLLAFVHQAMPLLKTNMTNTSIIKLAYSAASYGMDTNKSYRIPYEGSYSQELKEETLHVLVPDLTKNRAGIQHYLYDY